MNVDVSVIIVNYNTRSLLRQLFDSIEEHFAGFSYEIIVVDNDSSDSSRDFLAELAAQKRARVIFLEKNLGFGAANNRGFREANGQYLVLLNPDTVFRENSIQAVLDFRRQLNRRAIIGIKLIQGDGEVQHGKSVFPNIGDYFFQAFFLDSLFPNSPIFNRIHFGWQDDNEVVSVDSIRGAFMFMDRSVFAELRGFDEDFFLYTEEIDLCYRAHKKNIPVFYFPRTSLIHLEGRSMDLNRLKSFIMSYESKILFVRKHRGKFSALVFRAVLAMAAFNRALLNAVLVPVERSKFRINKFQLYLYSFGWFLGIPIKRTNKRLQLFEE